MKIGLCDNQATEEVSLSHDFVQRGGKHLILIRDTISNTLLKYCDLLYFDLLRLLIVEMSVVSTVIGVIRGDLSKLKIPGTHEKVYNDECMLSFDSPFSESGLFVNMSTFFGYGVDYYLADSARSNCRLYVHEKWTQIPRAETTMQTEGEVLHHEFKS